MARMLRKHYRVQRLVSYSQQLYHFDLPEVKLNLTFPRDVLQLLKNTQGKSDEVTRTVMSKQK